MSRLKVVVLGAGYAGLMTVSRLQKKLSLEEAEIVLVNKHEYHYLTTRLHEPSVGAATDDSVKIMLNSIIDSNRVTIKKDTVKAIKASQKKVVLETETIDYDYLVIALGGEAALYGIPGIKEHAFLIQSLNSAQCLRNHITKMFEGYKTDHNEARLTFVVVGAGFTGIELLGELADRVPEYCNQYEIPHDKVKMICIEAGPEVLRGFDSGISKYVEEGMEERRIELRLNTAVKECKYDGVNLTDGSFLKTHTVVWAGGVRGSDVVENAGFESIQGRVRINEYLEAPGHPDIIVLGDSGVYRDKGGKPYPPTAQIAIQQGMYCAETLLAKIHGQAQYPFVPDIKGTVLSIGKFDAVGIVFNRRIKGSFASLMKKVIEVRYILKLGGLRLLFRKISVLPETDYIRSRGFDL